jgi:ribonuclease R
MNLEAAVLDAVSRSGRPVSLRELVRSLDLEAAARGELKRAVRDLLRSGALVHLRGARLGLPTHMSLRVGRLTCNPGGFGFVRPEKAAADSPDVYVAAAHMKDALHGDRVVVRVERRSAKGPEGRIIRVLERALGRVVGRYEDDGRFGGHVTPFDPRILHDLIVPRGEEAGAQGGDMVVAEISRPPTDKRNPYGRVTSVLGRLDEPGVDRRVVMARYELPESFPPEAEAEALAVPAEVGEEDLAGRTDLRGWLTVTVDPETARDHDDAISLDRRAEGGFRLGVHIADVAHYVREGSALDHEAYLRGTSVYFPDHVVPMLPHALSSGLCSLVEGRDRLTQTVVLELDGRGVVRRVEFHDGVIRSAARLSYRVAQAVVDGDEDRRREHASLADLLLRMDELARLMRARRLERGALDLDQPEPRLLLGPTGEVTGVVAEGRLDSMRAIEEFMLAANEAVAERLHEASAPALYRIHEPPDPEKVAELSELLATFGHRLPPGLPEARPEDFQAVLRQVQGRPEERLVGSLLLRTLRLARYHPENLGHFGLATDMYAHFTSPIRRYPDLVVHRALRRLRQGRPVAALAEAERLAEAAEHLSQRERRANEAERELLEWKKVRFMAGKVGEHYAGYVTGVQAFGLFVELDEVFVQGLVHVSSMTDDYYRFHEKAHALLGENTRKAYRLGDRVEVQVVRVDLERRQVDFALRDVPARPRGRPRPGARTRPGGAVRPSRARGRAG